MPIKNRSFSSFKGHFSKDNRYLRLVVTSFTYILVICWYSIFLDPVQDGSLSKLCKLKPIVLLEVTKL